MSATAVSAPHRARLDSVDLLRGVVMIVMALDHVREYFHRGACCVDPTNVAQTTVALFLTRWITHFCAPVFVLLAGTAAYLYGARGRSRPELARFLVTRGLWLIVVELTVVRVALLLNLDFSQQFLQVIWAIGWSMIVLAALVFLPMRAIVAFAVVTIGAHNLLDGLGPAPFASLTRPETLTIGGWVWSVLHVPNPPIFYPLVPWVGVMALGYVLGPILRLEPARRRRALVAIGLACTAAFVLIRAANAYGDPSSWSWQPRPLFTVLSFVRTTKYPPSLLFQLMTLGPSIALLGVFDRAGGPIVRFVVTYGRVPFFYYVLHLYLIHALALAAAALTGHDSNQLRTFPFLFPNTYGFSLGVVYLVWLGVVLSLYVPCRWFAALKARRREPWLSYL